MDYINHHKFDCFFNLKHFLVKLLIIFTFCCLFWFSLNSFATGKKWLENTLSVLVLDCMNSVFKSKAKQRLKMVLKHKHFCGQKYFKQNVVKFLPTSL